MVTFLHTADWQIGMTRRWLQPEAQARFDHDRLMAIRSAGRIARGQGCAFVVVAGDVFESNQLRQGTVLRALDVMGEMGLPVYLLPGNHDPLDSVSIYRQPIFLNACPDNVKVLDTHGPYDVAPGVQVIAAPWRSKHPGRDLVADALATIGPADGTLRVLVGHGGVDVLDPTGRNPTAIATAPLFHAIQERRIHYVALGDRHSRTDVAGRGSVWFSGTVEVTDSREEAPGDVLVVDLSADDGADVVAHHTGTWDIRSLSRDLNSADDVDGLLAELASTPSKEKVVLKLALSGSLSLADYTRLHESLEALGTTFAGLLRWDGPTDLVISQDDRQWADMDISGYVSGAAAEIRAAMTESDSTGTEEDRKANLEAAFSPDVADDSDSARDALALLYRLSGALAR